jgi:hypothetical protein
MSIKPIDLQVLFSQLNQVGKEQAAQKDVPVANQSLQGSELVRKAEEQEHSVNQTKDTGEGIEQVKNDLESRGDKRSSQHGEKDSEDAKEKPAVFTDPELGQNVDLSG